MLCDEFALWGVTFYWVTWSWQAERGSSSCLFCYKAIWSQPPEPKRKWISSSMGCIGLMVSNVIVFCCIIIINYQFHKSNWYLQTGVGWALSSFFMLPPQKETLPCPEHVMICQCNAPWQAFMLHVVCTVWGGARSHLKKGPLRSEPAVAVHVCNGESKYTTLFTPRLTGFFPL